MTAKEIEHEARNGGCLGTLTFDRMTIDVWIKDVRQRRGVGRQYFIEPRFGTGSAWVGRRRVTDIHVPSSQ